MFVTLSALDDGLSLFAIKSKSSKLFGEESWGLELSVFGLHGSTVWGFGTGETDFQGSFVTGLGDRPVAEDLGSVCIGAQGSTVAVGDVLLALDVELHQGST